MKYVMWVRVDESISVNPADADPEPWVDEMTRRQVRIEGDGLRQVSDATTVRDGGRLVTDGPFAETKEQIAGYDLIDCSGLAEAIEIASKHPAATFGAIEVRQVWQE